MIFPFSRRFWIFQWIPVRIVFRPEDRLWDNDNFIYLKEAADKEDYPETSKDDRCAGSDRFSTTEFTLDCNSTTDENSNAD